MRKLLFLLTILMSTVSFSQVYEVGGTYNLVNISGEADYNFKLNSSLRNIGFIAKKNINPRIAYRVAMNLIDMPVTKIAEFSAGIDFNFKDYNLVRSSYKDKSTPYIIFELAPFLYYQKTQVKAALALPLGLGYKTALNSYFTASVEAKFRLALSDSIDGSNKFNTSTLDTYYLVGASLYYTFGWPKGSKNQTRF